MLVVREGKSARFAVNVRRGEGQTGEITLSVADLPAGLSVAPIVLAPGQSSAELTVEARGAVWGMESSFRVVAEAYGQTGEATVKVFPLGPIGAVDTRFGTGGSVSLPAPVDAYRECFTYLMSDGGVLVTTSPVGATELTRLRPDGSIDTSFGSGGILAIPPLLAGWERDRRSHVQVVVLPDDKIIVAVSADDPATASSSDGMAVLRYLPNGERDTSYASGGGITIFGSSRPFAAAAAPSGELWIWVASATKALMMKVAADGRTYVSGEAGAGYGTAVGTMVVQPDGKPVAVAGFLSGGYGLARFTLLPAPDENFGRGGAIALIGTALRWIRRSDGGYVGVGSRSTAQIPSAAWALQVDSNWRASPGYENGDLTLPSLPYFTGVVETSEGGNLVVAPFEGATRALHLLDGDVDPSLGPDGIATITTRTTDARLAPSGPHTAIFSWAVQSQSCELLRIWR